MRKALKAMRNCCQEFLLKCRYERLLFRVENWFWVGTHFRGLLEMGGVGSSQRLRVTVKQAGFCRRVIFTISKVLSVV